MSSRQAISNALKVELGRRYRFSASHRLHSPHLTAEENCRVFGKCNNPFGHGHNYVLEVSMSGDVDPATGMIANLADLDAFVERQVLEEFDHKSLNEDVAAFRGYVRASPRGRISSADKSQCTNSWWREIDSGRA